MNSLHGSKFLFFLILLLLLSCGPKRPDNVPTGAKYSHKGGAAWTLCEAEEKNETIQLFTCSTYSETGLFENKSFYFPSSIIERNLNLEDANDISLKWGAHKWWNGEMLLLVYKQSEFTSKRENNAKKKSERQQVYIARKKCLQFVEDGKPLDLKSFMKAENSVDLQVDIPDKFESMYSRFVRNLGEADRVVLKSNCLILVAFD